MIYQYWYVNIITYVKILLTLIVVRPTSSVDDDINVSNLDIVKNWLINSMKQN